MWALYVAVILVAVAVTAYNPNDPLQTDEIIEAVNAAKTTWKAGRNFHPSLKKTYLRNLVGAIKEPLSNRMPALKDEEEFGEDDLLFPELPQNFDAREKWKSCISLQQVRDQGSCGSCWAVSTAAAFTDRLCIASNGTFNGHLSAQHLVACCIDCGSGCNGGSPLAAWIYIREHGLVTGGDFNSKEGCQPYSFPECEHYVTGLREPCRDDYDFLPTPACEQNCYNKEYNEISFDEDFYKVNSTFRYSSYYPESHHIFTRFVQKQIYDNGPITTTFQVYEDFLAYKSGIYQHVTGDLVYGHAVKVIGWGEEGGIPYWLVANSWNSDWGENGFFKIKKGDNECGFEDEIYGGYPDV